MEEKVLITSENFISGRKYKLYLIILLIAAVACIAFTLLNYLVFTPNREAEKYSFYYDHIISVRNEDPYSKYGVSNYHWEHYWDSDESETEYDRLIDAVYASERLTAIFLYVTGAVLLIFIGSLIVFLAARKESITVTDKRVSGNSSFGRRVDLPIDSISAISTGAFKVLAVASASGTIKFAGIKNRDDIHQVISNLLIERQSGRSGPGASAAEETAPLNAAEELKSFKELLDSGVINREEFEAKKKQILGQ